MSEDLFSILIPSWNNLPFLKVCVDSIRKNSTYRHQIIVHVNEGTDGTLEWLEQEKIDYTYSKENIGVCFAMNMMRTRVETDYILFLNDDMYVLPEWDKVIYDEIKKLPDNRFFLSATVFQPHTRPSTGWLADYGDCVENFLESKLLAEYRNYSLKDWYGSTMPPNIVHRDVWDLVGGYSIEYSPGMYSDPDFTAKLWMAGIRYMKGLADSRVYHFETKSTMRIKKNNGTMQFLLKWGITSSAFRRKVTLRGQYIDSQESVATLRWQVPKGIWKEVWRSRIKALLLLLTKDFGTMKKLWK